MRFTITFHTATVGSRAQSTRVFSEPDCNRVEKKNEKLFGPRFSHARQWRREPGRSCFLFGVSGRRSVDGVVSTCSLRVHRDHVETARDAGRNGDFARRRLARGGKINNNGSNNVILFGRNRGRTRQRSWYYRLNCSKAYSEIVSRRPHGDRWELVWYYTVCSACTSKLPCTPTNFSNETNPGGNILIVFRGRADVATT